MDFKKIDTKDLIKELKNRNIITIYFYKEDIYNVIYENEKYIEGNAERIIKNFDFDQANKYIESIFDEYIQFCLGSNRGIK